MSHAANLGRLEIVKIAAQLGAGDFQHALGRALLQGKLDVARMAPESRRQTRSRRGDGRLRVSEVVRSALPGGTGRATSPMRRATAWHRSRWCLRPTPEIPREKHEILELFIEHGYDLPDTPIMAFHRGQVDRLNVHLQRDRQLIERRFTAREIYPPELGCAADGRSGLHGTPVDGTTLLHLAIEFDEQEIFAWLLEQGADPNARATIDAEGVGGHTPLFNSIVSMAAANGRQRDGLMTRELLARGASRDVCATLRKFLDWQETPGWHEARDVTPLEWARGFPERNWVNSAGIRILDDGPK